MRWRRGSQFILANSIVIGGQKAGLDIDDDSTASYYVQGISKFYNSFLNAYGKPFQVAKLVGIPALTDSLTIATITTTTYLSTYYANSADIMLTDPFNNSTPNLKPAAGSPALTTTGKFDVGGLTDAFFEPTNFIGAFDGTNDWTSQWAVWGK